ncbi:ATP synthase subunit b [Candidatus Desulfarcum epimagneticum]|uniref:ATP synthase subunit b n=1 Tax=uncultured Desulfobacteraceae bacterium TaxID=218296 RepID=A0A484HGG0_9BACT|nr:ATP synthase subunit b [uncultured Desulfobacteraceae bacterium]
MDIIKVDQSLLIQIFNFGFLIWALNIVLYRPIRKMLVLRKEKIEGLESQIEKSIADAADKDRAFVSGVNEARIRGLKEKEALAGKAAEEERAIMEEINASAQARLGEVRDSVAKDVDSVRGSLMKQVDDFADAICQKIIGRTV